ncbi:MAG TPA: hypothetical protein VKZ41_11895 [Gemmatimonadales bacterium]|nr:hypothetical protein [Gemmatimonadales bacterium]
MWTNRTKSFGFALAITAIAASAALPSQASAQEAEGGFANSWFWGVRAGAMSVQTNVQDEFAPMGGLEWLITRERVGLHIAVGQAFFNDIAVVVPDALGMASEVRIQDYREASASLLAFPVQWGGLRPYAGIGLALNLVRRATPIGAPDAETIEFIESSRSTISAKITLGAQAQYQNVAIFGEGSVLPTKREFLLNGEEAVFMINAGVRFNLGSAIEQFR